MVVLAVMVSMMASGQEDVVMVKGPVGELIKGYEYTYISVDNSLDAFIEVMAHAEQVLKEYGQTYTDPLDIENDFNINLHSFNALYEECMDGGQIFTSYILEDNKDDYVIAFVMLSIDEFEFSVEYRDK